MLVKFLSRGVGVPIWIDHNAVKMIDTRKDNFLQTILLVPAMASPENPHGQLEVVGSAEDSALAVNAVETCLISLRGSNNSPFYIDYKLIAAVGSNKEKPLEAVAMLGPLGSVTLTSTVSEVVELVNAARAGKVGMDGRLRQ